MSGHRTPWSRRRPLSSLKVPEPRTHPHLYTIPPSAPFLSTLARAILEGDLPCPGGEKPGKLALPQITIYLPTRRAARSLRDAFLKESGGDALLLPRIHALGQADEDAAFILDASAFSEVDSALGMQAIDPIARLIALMRLILSWAGNAASAPDTEAEAVRFNVTPAQGASLAADLASLMDFVESEEADFAALETLVPDDLASHWAATVDFLTIVTEHWPRHLEENGLVSPVARRNLLMAQEMKRLAAGSPFPTIAAGSTGTVPATARLLETVARMPNGAVILPGLDFSLDEESWDRLADHPEHPQAGMAELLRRLEVVRKDVTYVSGSAPDGAARARLHLVSETLRPAETTEQWQNVLQDSALSTEERASFANALSGLCLVEAPTAHDEAEAIALMMRSCIEEPDKTAALVTPDRILARRVAAKLKGYGLGVDDSAGVPVLRTVPGAFLDLLLAAVEKDFAAPELMALLKHPLTRLSRPPAAIRNTARALERGVFRDIYLGQGLSGIAHALTKLGRHAEITDTERAEAQELVKAQELVEDLRQAFAPLAELFASPSRHTASTLAEAHAAAAQALARDEGGAMPLWDGDAGEALTLFLSRLIEDGGGLKIDARAYAAFYRNLLSGQAVRPRGPAHPRLAIWGQLEARLQQPDVLILGSLNEGTWPRPQEAGPWLSRPMRAKLGLSPPERRIGLSAHDFAQALGAKSVFLTRALKVDGVPTVPSRWVQRLQALVSASGLSQGLSPEQPWVAWARMRDAIETFEPARPPRPCPPVAARPQALSVTQIERWIANPYEIYARHILKLVPLAALGAAPDAAMRGIAFHRILHLFAAQYPGELPDDIDAALNEIADALFETFGDGPSMQAFWRPSFRRFARWFAATEPQRRAEMLHSHSELRGALVLPSGFRLTARADRIDELQDGRVVVYDYKTGTPPNPKHVTELFAPQLPLEAAIAQAGGFAALGARDVGNLVYIHASGRQEGGEEQNASTEAASALSARALENLTALVAYFDDPETPYEVKRRAAPAFVTAYRYDDFEHLARVQEWMTEEADEDWR